jgi:hypothetical protein
VTSAAGRGGEAQVCLELGNGITKPFSASSFADSCPIPALSASPKP